MTLELIPEEALAVLEGAGPAIAVRKGSTTSGLPLAAQPLLQRGQTNLKVSGTPSLRLLALFHLGEHPLA